MHGLGPMSGRDLIVVGGSAGSLGPLTTIIHGLPIPFPACMLVVLHSSPENTSNLARILSRATRIPVETATHDRPIEPGIFVTARAYHLIVTPGVIHVTHGPKENGFHPAIELPRQEEVAMGGSDLDDPQVPGNKTDITDMNSTLGPPSGLTCPDCGGALWQIQEGNLVRFQCHVGHHYSPESLVMQQDQRVENALWTAVRALEERAELRRRMASQTEAAGLAAMSESFAQQARSAEGEANEIRELLSRFGPASTSDVESVELPARRKRQRQR
jgi:hypothetical protein